jgi:hypothetical protein
MSTHSGFNRNALNQPITVDVAAAVNPLVIDQGFLRDKNYSLVTKTPPTLPGMLQGWQRETQVGANYWALGTIAPGSAVSPIYAVQGTCGLTRDALGRLVQ